ncbi:hypothetical protein SAMN05444008_11950 [Cnuella takakiae]|uniref:Uncharacterized protein n=1 Tax=Cnuella takakiae TaxID=1302690 RepID=A0A1M5HGT4_9BACT|nr:hypothetical protein [Cnuella takakiae]SHG15150.1 hypothetical protein SAMN05444008_11950 [Cnuella takakiae]
MNQQDNKTNLHQPADQPASVTKQDQDPRQEAIEKEEDTARIRSEKQSVQDGSQQQDQ